MLDALENMDLAEGEDYTIIDANPGSRGRAEVQRIGGKSMVPFLVDGDTAMYESLDIIEYLKNIRPS